MEAFTWDLFVIGIIIGGAGALAAVVVLLNAAAQRVIARSLGW